MRTTRRLRSQRRLWSRRKHRYLTAKRRSGRPFRYFTVPAVLEGERGKVLELVEGLDIAPST